MAPSGSPLSTLPLSTLPNGSGPPPSPAARLPAAIQAGVNAGSPFPFPNPSGTSFGR